MAVYITLQKPIMERSRLICYLSLGLDIADVRVLTALLVIYDYTIEYKRFLWVVRKDGCALKHIPDKFLTVQMCSEAVCQNGYALNYLHGAPLMTREICLMAVRQYASAIQYVPQKFIDTDMCLTAVQRDGYTLKHVIKRFRRTPDPNIDLPPLFLAAVQQNGCALQHVPNVLITPSLCLEAVKQNGYALQHVPYELINAEMCYQATRKFDAPMRWVPDHLKVELSAMVGIRRLIEEELKLISTHPYTPYKN